MKKVINIILAIVSLSIPALAGDKTVVAPPVQVVDNSLQFTAKAFAASVIEDTDTYAFGGGVSLEVPLFYDLKLEAVGSLFEDQLYTVGANVLWYVPVTDNLSLYTLAGGAYEFETDQWTVAVGGGVKYSLSNSLSLFVDGSYNWTVQNDNEDGVVLVRTGIGFSF
jgi:hypothetical protein